MAKDSEYGVVLSGHPAGEDAHRFIGYGALGVCMHIKRHIDVALREDAPRVPFCGKRSSNTWVYGPVVIDCATKEKALYLARAYGSVTVDLDELERSVGDAE